MKRVIAGLAVVVAGAGLAACSSSTSPPSLSTALKHAKQTVSGAGVHQFVPTGTSQKFSVALPTTAGYDSAALDPNHPGFTKQSWVVDYGKVYQDVTVFVGVSATAAKALALQFRGTPPAMTSIADVSGHPAWDWVGTGAAAHAYVAYITAAMAHAENLVVLDGRVVYGVWSAGLPASANAAFIHSFSVQG